MGRLTTTLISSDSVALDTNIFIYAFDSSSPHHTIAVNLLNLILTTPLRAFISTLVFQEFLVRIYKQGLEKDIAKYEDFLTNRGQITVIDIGREICRTAARLRAAYSTLKAPDALHLACAIHSPAKKFLTFDRRLPKKIGPLSIISLT